MGGGEGLKPGKKVALHGANNGLEIALDLAGVKQWETIVIYDGDEAKTGKYLGDCPTPIRHASDPSYAEVDTVLVAATSFYREIRESIVERHGLDPRKIEPLFNM